MRNLSAKQKKALTKIVKDNEGILIRNTMEMTIEELETIYEMNPHECFDSNVNRFLNDLNLDKNLV
jgi:hypothetical protein